MGVQWKESRIKNIRLTYLERESSIFWLCWIGWVSANDMNECEGVHSLRARYRRYWYFNCTALPLALILCLMYGYQSIHSRVLCLYTALLSLRVCYLHETLLRQARLYIDRSGNAARSNESYSLTDMLYLGVTERCRSIIAWSLQPPISNMRSTSVMADNLGLYIGHDLWAWSLGGVVSYWNET